MAKPCETFQAQYGPCWQLSVKELSTIDKSVSRKRMSIVETILRRSIQVITSADLLKMGRFKKVLYKAMKDFNG